MLTPSVIYS